MIYQIYPLFKRNDIESANRYLIDYMVDPQSLYGIPTDMRDIIIQTLYHNLGQMFGVNSPQIANFIIVQNFVYGKLKNTLLNYMKYTNLDGNIIDWFPSDYTSVLISKKRKSGKELLDKWDPNELWDFSKDASPDDSILSPINGFMHMVLILRNVENKNFILALNRAGVISSKTIDDNNFKFDKLEVKLLPYNNFNKVLNIANAIFKNY